TVLHVALIATQHPILSHHTITQYASQSPHHHTTLSSFFFFNDTATTEIYTLSLHDALPISQHAGGRQEQLARRSAHRHLPRDARSEEHTSELQSLTNLVCRLLLEKKKKTKNTKVYYHREAAQSILS